MEAQSRPIEFRAYHFPTGTLYYNAALLGDYVYTDGFRFAHISTCVLMQFTGLYDSQGEKVFEGDILWSYYPAHGRNPSAEYWRVVVFREGCFVELQRIDEELTIYNFEPMQNTEDDRIVNCYYLQPELLELNTELALVPELF